MQRSTYYVVQFWASPRPDVDKYVCVPDSWLKWIDKSKAIASVAYPEGNPADIEELARNNRSNPNDWLAYNAYVTSFTNSYEQAMEYLRALRNIKSFGTISVVPTNKRGLEEDLPRQELTKFRLSLMTSNSSGNYVNNEACKRPSLASPYARNPTGQTRPQEKMKSSAGTAKRPRVSGSQDPVRDDRPSTSLQASLESRSTDVSKETSRSSPIHDVQTTRGISRDCQRPDEMPLPMYYVVEFLASPRPDVDKYVCVLDRWIRWIDKATSTVGVAYPECHPAEIEHMARRNQSDPDFWLAHNAYVKYCTRLYEQAMSFLRDLRASSGTALSAPISKRRFSEGPPTPQPTATTSSSGDIGANSKGYKRPLLTKAPMPLKRPQHMQSSAGTAWNSSVSGTQYPVHDDHPNRRLRTSLESRPMVVPQHNSPSTSMRDVQATQNFSHGCQRPGTTLHHACCATKFDAILEKVQANVHKLVTEINHWATVNARNNEKLEEVGVWVKDYQVWKRSVESQLRERPLMSGMPRNIKAEIILIDDDDVNHGNSTIPNQVTTPQESRGFQGRKMAQFSLPPEYDRNDSRWTLRHRYPRPTLTELVPHSRVYVNSIKLANSLVSAKDCKSLARLLVMEVFSDNALKVCSFTGARSTIYSCNSPVRPGLDEHARNTLVIYVKKCGRQKGWRIPDVQSINKTMRNKLHDCRRKARNGN